MSVNLPPDLPPGLSFEEACGAARSGVGGRGELVVQRPAGALPANGGAAKPSGPEAGAADGMAEGRLLEALSDLADEMRALRSEVEQVREEAERAREEAERARAETEKARIEAECAKRPVMVDLSYLIWYSSASESTVRRRLEACRIPKRNVHGQIWQRGDGPVCYALSEWEEAKALPTHAITNQVRRRLAVLERARQAEAGQMS